MKKQSIQIKIGFLMILAVILLSAAGYLSYRNLSSIVSSIGVDEKPDSDVIQSAKFPWIWKKHRTAYGFIH